MQHDQFILMQGLSCLLPQMKTNVASDWEKVREIFPKHLRFPLYYLISFVFCNQFIQQRHNIHAHCLNLYDIH